MANFIVPVGIKAGSNRGETFLKKGSPPAPPFQRLFMGRRSAPLGTLSEQYVPEALSRFRDVLFGLRVQGVHTPWRGSGAAPLVLFP